MPARVDRARSASRRFPIAGSTGRRAAGETSVLFIATSSGCSTLSKDFVIHRLMQRRVDLRKFGPLALEAALQLGAPQSLFGAVLRREPCAQLAFEHAIQIDGEPDVRIVPQPEPHRVPAQPVTTC